MGMYGGSDGNHSAWASPRSNSANDSIIAVGYAPTSEQLSETFGVSRSTVVESLGLLHEYHGVVLHPHNAEVWVIHPFSLAPTNFYVRSARGAWWGNCAWCPLGVAALLNEDVTITTTIGGQDTQVTLHIRDGQLNRDDLFIHFPIPMRNAWKNVIYTCSTMLVFEHTEQVHAWSHRHGIPVGDIQPVATIWSFAQRWYGNHLDPNWKKWTSAEAKAMFTTFGLTSDIWSLEAKATRF